MGFTLSSEGLSQTLSFVICSESCVSASCGWREVREGSREREMGTYSVVPEGSPVLREVSDPLCCW